MWKAFARECLASGGIADEVQRCAPGAALRLRAHVIAASRVRERASVVGQTSATSPV